MWDAKKNRDNLRKHKLSFETAQLVFGDPFVASRPDPYPHEERWQSIGMIGPVAVMVIHTSLEVDASTGEETGRIMSARKATAHEKKAYEDGDF
ncbi:MAG: BrnT family toxin [Rhodomicrobium sp.]